jgi:hypothetical protein
MRFRSVVLPAAVALAAVVAIPSSASAAVQCGLIVPSKVVINAAEVDTHMSLTDGCYSNQADHANWDYVHPGSGYVVDNDFAATDLAKSQYWTWTWPDFAPMGKWESRPTGAAQADGDPLTQNTGVTLVKYGSKIAATVTRTSTKLSWAATATQWSGRSHKNVTRPGVTVGLFHQTSSTAGWTYVKSATTSSTGKATISVSYPKSGNYRLVIAETPTVWAAYSSTIKGRI